jgi:hypothetical protein
MKKIFNDDKLIDLIKKGFGYKTDTEVAKYLGLNKSTIHNVRHKTTQLGILQRLKILDKIAFLETRSIMSSMLPENLSEAIYKKTNYLAHKRISNSITSDSELLNLFKEAFDFKTDAELAKYLELATNSISMVRTGKSNLGPLPKIKMLEKASNENFEELRNAINSNEIISNAIEDWIIKNK